MLEFLLGITSIYLFFKLFKSIFTIALISIQGVSILFIIYLLSVKIYPYIIFIGIVYISYRVWDQLNPFKGGDLHEHNVI